MFTHRYIENRYIINIILPYLYNICSKIPLYSNVTIYIYIYKKLH